MSLATYHGTPPDVEAQLKELLQQQEKFKQQLVEKDNEISRLNQRTASLENWVTRLCRTLGMQADGESHGLRSHGLSVSYLLPKSLQGKYVVVDALDKAVQAGLICIEDGVWHWQHKSKTLLAYFCGRVWCGDMPRIDPVTRLNIWRKGCMLFPDKELQQLFQINNLRLSRKQRIDCAVPEGAEVIDNLFDS